MRKEYGKKKILHLTLLLTGLLLGGLHLQAQTDTMPPLEIGDPSNVTETVDYDPVTDSYTVTRKIGNTVLSSQTYPGNEYRNMTLKKGTLDYWRDKEAAQNSGETKNSLIPDLKIAGDGWKNIFGSNKIEIRPQGTAELILGVRVNKNDNPNIPQQQRTVTTFNFDQNIKINLLAKIGDKINFNTNFDTKALFNFENQLNLKYEGGEDDILQLLEFGNVQLPLTGTLIQGTASTFGFKNKLRFGKLEITSIFGQQQGQKQNLTVQGGAQITKFEVAASSYEANRHYFVSDYFMNLYDQSMSSLPFVTSPVYITRMEVWITNKTNTTENVRNIVAILPLGETLPNTTVFPQNSANTYDPQTLSPEVRNITSQYLFNQLDNGLEIEKLANARLLQGNEYTFDPYLGYVSLNQSLNADEVLAVSFQYTAGGQTYQVGEFSTDIPNPNALVVKLLKSSIQNVQLPNWRWMMKNIYSINGYNIGQEDFALNVLYLNSENGAKQNFLPQAPGNLASQPLLRLFNLDQLNQQNDQIADGYFDFIEGRTIRSQNGRIIFPVREPFSTEYLTKVFEAAAPGTNVQPFVDRYAFDSLYRTIQALAELNQEKNRFYLGGSYKGASGSEISLNAFNVPQGSVTVTAGGQTLMEGSDYTVDYAAGKVRIINESILNSGIPINIALENNATFNIQQKRLIGTHLDYKVSKNFQIGLTVMNLRERPLTQKIDAGMEPINNTQIGADVNYSIESPFITRLVDKIPGIDTKAPSLFTVNGEVAGLIPGYNKVIDKNGENGVSYIDDFEGAETPIDVRNQYMWKLGTVPLENPSWPNGIYFNDLRYNFNRARMTWFTMDPLFYRQNSITPPHIKNDNEMRSNLFLKEVLTTEIFKGFQPPYPIVNPTQQILDLHFYPDERGPYNYDAAALDPTYTDRIVLQNPRENFGSMMRRMETTDWDAANVSYIEFWMMDPFFGDASGDLNKLKEYEDGVGAFNKNTTDPNPGGDFYLQIGNMSEDLLRDGRMDFENGLPTPTDPNRPVDTTVWGRVPLLQPINQNFDNDPATREFQDVGYDGMNDQSEIDQFNAFYMAADAIYSDGFMDSLDVSADNYRHYNGGVYNQDVLDQWNAIHTRYKFYVNPERNSPVANINEAYGQLPNTEDVNQNFTLDQPEAYYQYRISMRPNDLDAIGENFITDIQEFQVNTPANVTKTVRWIQFRVPVRTDNKETYGNIFNFRSIRFMRMLLKGFPDDIFLRLATLQLVRADWRKYEGIISDIGPYTWANPGDFNSTTVNVEENQQKAPFPYAVPPGITREIDPSNPQLNQLNEQALVMNVCNLNDGEGQALFKTTEYDMRAYRRLKMYVHAEAPPNTVLDSNDLTVFVRLGLDGSENYYEYEVPLKVSDPGGQPSYFPPSNDPTYQRNVWPEQNLVDIDLQALPDIKLERNAAGFDITQPYQKIIDGRRITIVGNPNIANVRVIMVGVKNPAQQVNPFQDGQNGNKMDDGQQKCAQIWVNEMRLTDFFEQGGMAAKARAELQLADFGKISMAVMHTTFGWGNIEQKPAQRSRDNTTTFDFSTQFEFGKFFGQKAGVQFPVYFGYSTSIANPQFNPLDPDVKFRNALAILPTQGAKDSLRQAAQTVTTRKSFNITDLRKNRTGNTTKMVMPWSISNFNANYSYIEENFRDIKTEYHNYYEHKASLAYNWAPTVTYWEPFKKSKKLKSPWVKWIKEFNFTLIPKRVGTNLSIQRDIDEFQLRNITDYNLIIVPTSRRNFVWMRTYEFQYNPFKSLTFTFSAANASRIDESDMVLDATVAPRIQAFGRNTSYNQSMDITYAVPFNKLPLTDWITASVGYNTTYRWTAANMQRDQVTGVFGLGRFGNVAQNGNTWKGTAQLNFATLYNKIPYLKEIQKPYDQRKKKDPKKEGEEGEEEEEKEKIITKEKVFTDVNFKAGRKKKFKHKLRTEEIVFKVVDKDGREIKGETQVIDKKSARFISTEDVKDATVTITGTIRKKKIRWGAIPEGIVKIVTGLKNVSVTYNQTNGTILPGYKATTTLFGVDLYRPSVGPDFVFGRQYNDRDLFNQIVDNNWFVNDSAQNVLFMRTFSENLNATATYEPFKGIKVTLTASRTYAENYQSNYRFVPSLNDFAVQNPMTTGNFNISYMTLNTAFVADGPAFTSRLFDEMLGYRSYFSARLAQLNPVNAVYNPNALYQDGYKEAQQDVLLYSFLAAYRGIDPEKQEMNLFPAIPIPNWRIQFDGLKEIPAIKKALKNIVISHSYSSTFSIAGYQSNAIYNQQDPQIFDDNPFAYSQRDQNGNFIAQYFINSVTLVESFNPLIKVDLSFKNDLQLTVEVKSSRNITLNFPNSQLTEVKSFEVAVGAGYIFKDVKLPFSVGGKRLVSDLTVRADIGIRDNSTVLRRIQDQVEQVTAGQRNVTIKTFAEYAVNKNVAVRLFVDHIFNRPFAANQYKTANTNAGLSIRFTLAN